MGRRKVHTLFGILALFGSVFGDDGFVGENGEEGFLLPQHSLRKPYLDSTMQIPNWAFMGDTVVTKNMARLTPDKPSKSGSLWNYVPNYSYNWEIEFEFKVAGSAAQLYGDGFAFWYTKDWGVKGNVFGNQDLFTGLAVFFDTYSNHQGEHNHGHPYVSAMLNDGTREYDHDADGTQTELAGCQASFRGKDWPTKAKVSYVNRTLTVELNYRGFGAWDRCFQETGVDLPTSYFFGFSAATGALSDNHDILSTRVLGIPTRNEVSGQKDYKKLKPQTDRKIKKRPRAKARRRSTVKKIAYKGSQALFYLGIVAAIGVAVVFVVRMKLKEKRMKRF